MNFEEQLLRIAEKEELIKMITNMKDDAKVAIIIEDDHDEATMSAAYTYGFFRATYKDVMWMIELLKKNVLTDCKEDDAE